MRITTNTNRRITNGSNHHFFSRAQNRKNSRKTVHMNVHKIAANQDPVEFKFAGKRRRGASKHAVQRTVVTNAAGTKISNCDPGGVSLTNHHETCLSLGTGRSCILTPQVIDGHNVEITLPVESRTNNGKIHDLFIRQVVTRSGKSFEVAADDYNFSLTPDGTSK